MDFSMDIDKVSYIICQYDSVINNLNQYISDYCDILDELSPSWDGLAKEIYFNRTFKWLSECSILIKDVEELRNTLNINMPSACGLLDRGKMLEV